MYSSANQYPSQYSNQTEYYPIQYVLPPPLQPILPHPSCKHRVTKPITNLFHWQPAVHKNHHNDPDHAKALGIDKDYCKGESSRFACTVVRPLEVMLWNDQEHVVKPIICRIIAALALMGNSTDPPMLVINIVNSTTLTFPTSFHLGGDRTWDWLSDQNTREEKSGQAGGTKRFTMTKQRDYTAAVSITTPCEKPLQSSSSLSSPYQASRR